eukprot:COSAG02_NODE_8463_length_2563_cov_23.583198_2_plen_66_part_01
MVDLAGNTGEDANSTVDGTTDDTTVTVDQDALALTVLTLVSSNSGASSLAKAGDLVTLSITASKPI